MSQDMAAPAPKKSKVPMILGILGVGFIVAIACCGGCSYWAFQQGMAPFAAATESMNGNAELTEKLGSPIEYDMNGIQLNNMVNNNGEGSADIGFTAKGPNGTANVSAQLNLTGNKWSVQTLNAECSDGSTVTIP